MEGIDNEEFLDIFISDTNGTLENMEILLLKAEANGYNHDIVDEIFRAMHSMKGSSATMGYDGMAKLTHAMEDIFAEIRKSGSDNIDSSWLTSMLLVCKDFLSEELTKISNGKTPDGDVRELVEEIKKHKGFIKQYEELPYNTINETFSISNMIGEEIEPQENFKTYYAKIFFEKDSGMLNVRALILVQRIGECMMIREHIPYELTNEKSEDIISRKGFQIMFDSEMDMENVRKFIENNTACLGKLDLSSVSSDDTLEKEENRKSEKILKDDEDKKITTHESKMNKGSISVAVQKLDKLMDITSEIIITQALLIQNPDLKGLELQNFEKVARQFKKISNELQDTVMSLRMLPISQVFMKMKRIVRDASEKLGKKIELTIVGETTEVDKNIIEMISDPLMHLIRNSIDHGIEMPDKRTKSGKGEIGNITLEARHVGSEVWIEVIDDGGGLNKERIYEKAIENGLTEKMMEELKEMEIYNFIFAPGFSTKEETTEYSGRGVGMDVVYKNLEKLHGSVSIEKTSSKGTTIILKIPLTLAIINGMTVKVGSSKYTVPVESIIEIMALKQENIIISTDGKEIINIRNKYYPIVRLHDRFKIPCKTTDLTEGMALIVQNTEEDICIFADELVGEQQVVVKPLPEYLKKVKGVAGCSLLGDGTISLILDTDKLF
jgi:two-component system, chemotaxis family, sensor kinase CheA